MNTTALPAAGDTMRWPEWRLVLLLMAICGLAHFNRVSMVVAGDLRIMKQYDLTTAQMGSVYSAFLLAYTVMMVPGGWLIDRLGPRFALAMVCLGSSLFILLTAAAGFASLPVTMLVWLYVVRLVMGVVSTPLHPASAKVVALAIPIRHRSTINGLVTGAALVGVAITFVVFGALVDWLDWPLAFVVTATITLALGFLWLGGARGFEGRWSPAGPRPQATSEARATTTTPLAWLARHKNLILLTLSYGAVGYFQYLFFYWVHHYFETVLKLGEQESRWYAMIPSLCMAVSMPLGGWVSDRIQAIAGWRAGRVGVVMAAMITSGLLLLCGLNSQSTFWIVTWLSLALGSLGLAEGPFWASAVEVGRGRGGLSASVVNTGGNGFGAIAPWITPVISDTLGWGWENGLALASIVVGLGAVCWLGISPEPPDRVELGLGEPMIAPGEIVTI